MGSLIRTTAEGVVDAAGQPVFDIVAQIGFDLSKLENAPAADVIIDFSNVVTLPAVASYVRRTGLCRAHRRGVGLGHHRLHPRADGPSA